MTMISHGGICATYGHSASILPFGFEEDELLYVM